MARDKKPQVFLDQPGQERVRAAVAAAERLTSGEIRVYLEGRLPLFRRDPYRRARRIFARLGMHATGNHNGVLIYLATHARRCAIVGDEALHQHVGNDFWRATAEGMARHFAREDFADGLVEAVGRVGERLARHFPRQSDDVNELSDEVGFGR